MEKDTYAFSTREQAESVKKRLERLVDVGMIYFF
jgi:hypothetical protein